MKLRKILSLALALTMMLALVPVASVAEEEVTDQYRITDEPVTLKLIRSDNSNQLRQLGNEVLQAIEKYTGVQLEIEAIAGSDFTTKTEMLIATGAGYEHHVRLLLCGELRRSGRFRWT